MIILYFGTLFLSRKYCALIGKRESVFPYFTLIGKPCSMQVWAHDKMHFLFAPSPLLCYVRCDCYVRRDKSRLY